MITRDEINKLIISTTFEFFKSNEIECEINLDTPLIGRNSVLDSMGLVNLIVDIEIAFLELGHEVSLTSDAAMSLRISPFRTIGSLSTFIASQFNLIDNIENE